jgi:transglutaminase-like putative cysteine protease
MSPRRYELVHRTTYDYPEPVTTSYGRAVLLPRDLPDQRLERAEVVIDPTPADHARHTDYFGSTSTYFAVTTPHTRLTVTASSTLTITREQAAPERLPALAWEAVAQMVRDGAAGTDGVSALDAREVVLPSRHVVPSDAVRAWAAPSFAPGRSIGVVLADLGHRIRTEMTYRSGSTTISTTQAELLDARTGVCQDFAHLMIAALRAHGLPGTPAGTWRRCRRPDDPRSAGPTPRTRGSPPGCRAPAGSRSTRPTTRSWAIGTWCSAGGGTTATCRRCAG